MKKILVLYHANCPDGFGAAWAAWKKFGAKAEYMPVEPEGVPTTFPRNREIYAVDVSYRKSVQEKFRRENKKFVIIDHHASRKKDVESFPENVFDNNHSGAVLAWGYFHPKKKIPRLLKYVEDIDLWKIKLPNAENVMPYIYMQERSFSRWSAIAKHFETAIGFREYLSRGKLLKEYEESAMGDIIKNAELVLFEGMKTYALNNTYKRYTSELGRRLINKKPPIAVIWYERKEGLKVSLRSNGSIDVSKIAAKYGGGGHKKASSFLVPSRKKPWKNIK